MPKPPTLTAKQFAQVSEIFDVILDRSLLGAPARAFIVERAGGDQAVVASLEGMLLAHEAELGVGEDEGLQASAREAVRVEVEAAGAGMAEAMPRMIGPYEIVRFIASGGMGTVYEAWQQEPRRRVAIKVIRFELLSRQSVRRFEAEGHLLAGLRHEGIARVHAMGRTDTPSGSVPYLVLEYIDGTVISDYVRTHQLDVPARLTLLRKVCDAVQYAHDNGVLHRDLKPGNILVDGQGRPRVLDFGIARSFDDAAHQASLTASGMFMGTLAYMSPEQVMRGQAPLDVRVDVYGVGAVGYEILTGGPPHDIRGLPIHEAIVRIGRHDARPLTSHDSSLGGDLSAIFGKALAQDPDRRYLSARALDEDLRRYLEHEPVMARAPSALYQVGKLVRRNRVTFGLLALVLVSLSVGLGLALAQRREALDARREAQRTAREAERDSRAAQLHAAWTAMEAGRVDEASEFLVAEGAETMGVEFDLLRARAYSASEVRSVDVPDRRLVVLSPDGNYAVSRRPEGPGVRLDLRAGTTVSLLPDGYKLPFRAFGFAPGRPDWLVAETEEAVTVIEVGTRRIVRTLDRSSPVIGLAGRSEVLHIWERAPKGYRGALLDLEQGAIIRDTRLTALTRDAHSRVVLHGRYVVSQRQGTLGEVLDLDTLTTRQAPDVYFDEGQVPRLTPDGRFLVHTLPYPVVYDLAQGERFHVSTGAGAVLVDAAVSRDSRLLATLGMDARVRVWDLHTREQLYTATDARLAPGFVTSQVHRRSMGAIGFQPGGTGLRTVMAGKLAHWSTQRPATRFDHAVKRLPFPHVYALAWHPRSRWLASAAWDDRIVIWDTARGVQVGELDLRVAFREAYPTGSAPRMLEPTCLTWSPDGRLLAVYTARGRYAVWSVWDRRSLFDGMLESRLLHLDNDAGLTFSKEDGGTLRITRTEAEAAARVQPVSLRPAAPPAWAWNSDAGPWARHAFGFAFSGRRVAAGRHTHTGHVHEFRVWQQGAQEPLWVGRIPGDALSVELADEGRRLFLGTRGGTIQLYDVDQRRRLLVLRAHEDYIVALALAPDGSALASGSGDGWVRLDPLVPIGERMRRMREAEVQHKRLEPLVASALRQGGSPEEALRGLLADPRLAHGDRDAVRAQFFSALK